MENIDPLRKSEKAGSRRGRLLFAISLYVFIYVAYFYNLIRQQLLTMIQKQTALESVKAIAVPGTSFLNNVDSLDILKSTLFYLLPLGTMFLVFLLFSLLFDSPWKRAVFVSTGFLGLLLLTINDRVGLSFSFVNCISFTSFYLITLPNRTTFSLKEVFVLPFVMMLISVSLFYGSKNNFFVKARDRVFFNTALGNRMISFYYTHSPLAASPISKEQGVYQGLVYHDGVENKRFVYLGGGVFLTGNGDVRESADFVIKKKGQGFFIVNRYGRGRPIEAISKEEIERAVEELFSMKGFLFLNRIGLYFCPAGLFILLTMGTRWLTDYKKIFLISSTGMAAVFLLSIWYVNLTGNSPPDAGRLKSAALSSDGLSVAYYLYDKKAVPEPYIPFVEMMTKSESTALRYWGAYFLGILGDPKDTQTLLTLMKDPHPNVRYMAAQSLYGLIREGSFRHLLIPLLSDPSWYVRCRVFSLFLSAGTIPAPA